MNKNLRIIFFGTPNFAAIVLEKMINAGYKPVAVVTAPDKPVGRKQILTPSPVKTRIMNQSTKLKSLCSAEHINMCSGYELGIRNEIKILQSERIENLKPEILNLKPDLIVLAAFGQIIPREILEIPKYGCLNIHPSLLPKYRGASPIQATILNGDQETGATIMLMDEKLDHGDIVASSRFKIKDLRLNCEELTIKLAEMGAELLIETIPKWVDNEIKTQAQDENKATFTKIIEKEDGHINWQKSAEEIERMVRAFNPWPGAFTRIMNQSTKLKSLCSAEHINMCSGNESRLLRQLADSGGQVGIRNKMLKVIKAEVLKVEHQKKPGTVFIIENNPEPHRVQGYPASDVVQGKKLAIACKQDVLILEEVQLEGKKVMSSQDFINGYSAILGSILR